MNGRKARQLRSQGGQKRMRRFRKDLRATAAEHNAAVEAMQAELAEAEAYRQEVVERLQAEQQFLVLDPFSGRPIMQVAESMLFPIPKDEEEAAPDVAATEAAPKIILPGTAEALGVETP